ncbi:MAG: anti-sigma factor family protein [Christensenellales bacterium]
MRCEEIAMLLPELLGGSLDAHTEAEALEHLACCAACRSELALWSKVEAVTAAQAPPLPAAIRRRVGSALQRQTESAALRTAASMLRDTVRITGKTIRLSLLCARSGLPEGA